MADRKKNPAKPDPIPEDPTDMPTHETDNDYNDTDIEQFDKGDPKDDVPG